jgi:hypothetical protein
MTMNAIYKHIRAAYKAGQMSNVRIDRAGDGNGCYVCAGVKCLQWFASVNLAEQEIAKQQAKAAKFIQ